MQVKTVTNHKLGNFVATRVASVVPFGQLCSLLSKTQSDCYLTEFGVWYRLLPVHFEGCDLGNSNMTVLTFDVL